MPIEIRDVPERDLRRWVDAVEVAFAEEASDARWEELRRLLEPGRVLGAYDGGAIVGGGGAFSFRLTVPGGRQVGAAGVTAVGVMPTHRRQGILRELMRRQLHDVRAAGEAMAILWASEGGIYQRFGYGLASLNGSLDVERDRAVFRTPAAPEGSFRLVDRTAAAQAFAGVYERVSSETPGFYERSATRWEIEILGDRPDTRQGRSPKFCALYDRDGEAAGYAIYRVRADWDGVGSHSVLEVQEALAVDAPATRDVWRYLFNVDLIARITSRLGPPDHPLLLMLAEPRRLRLRLGDGLWLRIVDVPAALEGRGYADDGELVLEVTDEFLSDAAGRWRLSVSEGHGRVEPTDQPADLRLDVTDLGAIYLGAFSVARLASAGRTDELRAGARRKADRLFATDRQPWCPEVF